MMTQHVFVAQTDQRKVAKSPQKAKYMSNFKCFAPANSEEEEKEIKSSNQPTAPQTDDKHIEGKWNKTF